MKELNMDIIKERGLQPYNILYAWTDTFGYEEERYILVTRLKENFGDIEEVKGYDYILLNSYHCSCYDFTNSSWHAMLYTYKELLTIAKADYNKDSAFWQNVLRIVDGI